MSRLVRSKRITNPFDVIFSAAIEQNAIEAAIALGFSVGCQIVLCGENDASLFGTGDACPCAAEACATAAAHFNKDKGFSVAADEVDFTAPTAEIARQNLEAVLFKKSCRQTFGEVANRLAGFGRGIVSAH